MSNHLISKIIYRSTYRGTREMDLLLSQFNKSFLKDLSDGDLAMYDEILQWTDEQITEAICSHGDNNVLRLLRSISGGKSIYNRSL